MPNSPPPSRLRQLNSRLFPIFFGILLGWLLVEILLRLTFPHLPFIIQSPLRYVRVTPFSEKTILPAPGWYPVDGFQYTVRPDMQDELQFPNPDVSFHISSKNWLDPNSNIAFRVPSTDWQPNWPINLLVLGDSFSFCFTEYENCWTRLLETEYEQSVVNLALSATGSLSHYNVLATFGLPYEPELVVWQWYGNDFNEDYGLEYRQTLNQTDNTPTIWSADDPALVNWLRANSGVYWLVTTLLTSQENRAQFNLQRDRYLYDDGQLTFRYGRPYVGAVADLSLEKNRTGQALTERAITEANGLLAEQGIPMLILLMPWKEEVYRHITEAELGVDGLQLLAEGRLAMLDFCRQSQLSCLDMTQPLRDAALRGEQVYIPADTHLNEVGNRIVAEALWAYLAGN